MCPFLLNATTFCQRINCLQFRCPLFHLGYFSWLKLKKYFCAVKRRSPAVLEAWIDVRGKLAQSWWHGCVGYLLLAHLPLWPILRTLVARKRKNNFLLFCSHVRYGISKVFVTLCDSPLAQLTQARVLLISWIRSLEGGENASHVRPGDRVVTD